MNRIFLLLIFSVISHPSVHSQEVFRPITLDRIIVADTLDSQDYLYAEGGGFAVQAQYENATEHVFLCLSKKEAKGIGWDLTDVLYGDVISLDTLDVTGDGKFELLLYTQDMYGHSGWQGGLSSIEESVCVIDVEKGRVLLIDTYHMETEAWWNVIDWGMEEEDEPEIIDSDGEYNCESFFLKFKSDTLHFLPDTSRCEGMERGYTATWNMESDAFEVLYPEDW